jgi:hypothetical protein
MTPYFAQFGLYGSDYITDTDEHDEDESPHGWLAIQALEETVLEEVVSGTMNGTLEDIPLPAGVTIFGRFSNITLSAGKVIAYRAAQ